MAAQGEDLPSASPHAGGGLGQSQTRRRPPVQPKPFPVVSFCANHWRCSPRVYDKITKFYFDSGDFNGYPIFRLKSDFSLGDKDVTDTLAPLIETKGSEVAFGNMHPNPHIKAFGDVPVQEQLGFLPQGKLNHHSCR